MYYNNNTVKTIVQPKSERGEKMILSKKKIDIAMSNRCMTSNELQEKSTLPRGTFLKVICEKSVRPVTAGKIARALNVPVEQLIETEGE